MRPPGILMVAAGLAAACESHPEVTFATPTAPPAKPSPPAGVVASAGNASITVSWARNDPAEAATSYSLYGASVPWADWHEALPGSFRETVICSNGTSCNHTRAGLQNEQEYWLGLTASNALREGPRSALVSARPPGLWSGRVFFASENETLHDSVISIVIDTDESLLVAGCAAGPMVYTTGAGAFLARLDARGAVEWVKLIPSTNCPYPRVTAAQNGAATLAGRISEAFLDLIPQGEDGFIVTYDRDGNHLWHALLGSAADDVVHAVATDESGNVYVAGETAGSLPENASSGGVGAFVAKFLTSGARSWVRQVGSSMTDIGRGVGARNGLYDHPTRPSGPFLGPMQGGFDYFLIKFNAGGAFLLGVHEGTSGDDLLSGLSVDMSGSAFFTARMKTAKVGTRSPSIATPSTSGVFQVTDSPTGSSTSSTFPDLRHHYSDLGRSC